MNERPPRRPGAGDPRSAEPRPDPNDLRRPGFGGHSAFAPATHPPAGGGAGSDPLEEASGGGAADDYVPFGGRGWDPSLGEAATEDEEDLEGEDASPRRRRRAAAESPFPRKTLPSLTATARVERDSQGIPHIRAKSERDAYAALGYCMAEDRLWQMDVLRRLALGRAAEIFGQTHARHDALMRTIGVPRRAAAAAGRLAGVARDVLAAFVGGLNVVRAAERPVEVEALGYEIEPWTITDCLAVELLLAWQGSVETWPQKILAARAIASAGLERARWVLPFPVELDLATEERTSLWRRLDLRVLDLLEPPPGVGPLRGCAVAFAGSRTAGGGALLAATVELPTTLPAATYLAHLEAPGLNVAGAAYVGLPVFVAARNAGCAWSVASAPVDDADCVVEELDGIGNFRTEAGWTKLNRRSEVIRIAGAGQMRIEVAETRHGPLLSQLVEQLVGPPAERRSPGLALRWGANSLGSSIAGWLALARSRSVKDLGSATRDLDRGPLSLEIVAGDAAGAVCRVVAGGIPQRDAVARLPVRGWRSEGRWTSVVGRSIAAVPPPGDVVVQAGEATPSGARSLAPATWRSRRLAALAAELGQADASLCATLLADRNDAFAQDLLPQLRAAARAVEDAGVRSALEAVRFGEWDGCAVAESAAATIFYLTVLEQLPRELFGEARFGPLAALHRFAAPALAAVLAADSSPWFPDAEAKQRAIGGALGAVVDRLSAALGADPTAWRWGSVSQTLLAHPLAAREELATASAPPWGTGGSPFAVLAIQFAPGEMPLRTVCAPAARLIADLATDQVQAAIASGESGRPRDPHFLDQLELLREGRAVGLALSSHTTAQTLELIPG